MDYFTELINALFQMKDNISNADRFDCNVFIVNILIIAVIFIIYYDIKPKELYKNRNVLMVYIIAVFIDFCIELIMGKLLVIAAIVSFFLIHVIFFLKDREGMFDFLNKTSKSASKEEKTEEELELDDIHYKIKRLGKDSNFNIVDILYIYDYITEYQRRKLIQNLITENLDTMISYLLSQPIINDEELKEARAIQNLIEFENRLVTKDEAVSYLIQKHDEERESHNEESAGEDYDEIG